ncbi:unnamed protein product [Cyprideis torosa]|uniref:Exportin-4 n=1 Tax=Cyprideis torosa TaxID=163714 RepID=A0A7R8ZPB2_9CRUS|nr:unnamed protein product [Cyprideis torosa]CAG0900131.1 unnamed protein product [Cyprideis torosa]
MTSLVMGGKSSEMVIQELETASRIFMSPPSAVTQEQRHQAENIFLQFRKTPNPYGMCQSIFMSCSNPQILFETAALLRDAILREWSMLSEEQICGLLQVILELLAQHVQDWKPFVKEKLMELLPDVLQETSSKSEANFVEFNQFQIFVLERTVMVVPQHGICLDQFRKLI